MDLTFQVPMQYCSLQHQTLLPSPVTSTAGWCFHFGSVSSFFLELFLHWSPVAYWAPTNLGSSSFSVISFCFFILFMAFSRQEYWSGLPFPSPVDHILSELSAMTRPSWVALHSMAHSFIELDKALIHVISLVSHIYICVCVCVCVRACVYKRLQLWAVCYTGIGYLWRRGFQSRARDEAWPLRSLCSKVLLKSKRDRESFWHRQQKGTESVPPC